MHPVHMLLRQTGCSRPAHLVALLDCHGLAAALCLLVILARARPHNGAAAHTHNCAAHVFSQRSQMSKLNVSFKHTSNNQPISLLLLMVGSTSLGTILICLQLLLPALQLPALTAANNNHGFAHYSPRPPPGWPLLCTVWQHYTAHCHISRLLHLDQHFVAQRLHLRDVLTLRGKQPC